MPSTRARRRRRTQSAAPATRSRFIALSLAGTLLLAATFRGAYAAPIRPTYGTGGGQGTGSVDNGGGLSDGEVAGIAAGGVLTGGAIWWFVAGGRRKKKKRHTAEPRPFVESGQLPESPLQDVSSIRLVGADEVQAGDAVVYRLEVKSAAGEWRAVTEDEGASVEVSKSALVPMDGAKNAFALPITCSRSADGQVAQVTGSFHPAGGPVWTATKQVKLVVPEAAGS